MAFCKFCGNEIPDGTTCTCPGAQAAAQAGNTADAAVNAVNNYDPAFGGDNGAAAPAADGIKKLIPLIIAGVVAVIVIIALIIGLSPKTHAKSTLKKYVKAELNKKGADKVLSYMVPSDVLKDYKNDNEEDYDDLIEKMNEETEEMLEDVKGMKLKDITGVKELKKSQLAGAEFYFKAMCCGTSILPDSVSYYLEDTVEDIADEIGVPVFDVDPDEFDVKVTKGYQIKFKIQYKDEDGDKQTDKGVCCVVKVKGDGWKVINCDADDLSSYGEYADAIDELEKEAKKSKNKLADED